MRNLKKVLALVLAMAMSLSLAVTAGATYKTFPDQADIENEEAVFLLNALDIVEGRENGEFDPAANINRAEAAKLVAALNLAGVPVPDAKGVSSFSDVLGDGSVAWANDFIEYGVSQGSINGMGDGTFAPKADVTGVQFAKMLLGILGYDAAVEGYTGTNWMYNVNIDAVKAGLYRGLDIDATAALSRDDAAQMMYNALYAFPVIYLTDTTGALKITGKDLLSTIYPTIDVEFGIMNAASYNVDEAEYTYTVAVERPNNATVDKSYVTEADYTDMLKMRVMVVYDEVPGEGVQGIYAFGNGAVDTGLCGDLEEDYTDLVDDCVIDSSTKYFSYTVECNEPATKAVDEIHSAVLTDWNKDWYCDYEEYKAIDNDNDGTYDVIIYFMVDIAEVTYVNAEKVTAVAEGTSATYKYADNTIAAGLAVEDTVAVYGDTSLKTVNVIEKIAAQSGTVNSATADDGIIIKFVIGGKPYYVCDQWDYSCTPNVWQKLHNWPGKDVNFYVYNGYLVNIAEDVSLTRDFLLITSIASDTNRNGTSVNAKAVLGDGTAADITIASLDDQKGLAMIEAIEDYLEQNKFDNPYNQYGYLARYEVVDGEYELTSTYTLDQMVNAEPQQADLGFDGTAANYDAVDPIYRPAANNEKVGYIVADGEYIRVASDAQVFLVETDGVAYSVVSGADIINMTSTTAQVNYVGYEKGADGFYYATLIYIQTALEYMSDTQYGIITSEPVYETVKTEDGTLLEYAIFDLFDGKDTSTVYADSSEIHLLELALAKGNLISFRVNDGMLYNVEVITADGDTSGVFAITGYSPEVDVADLKLSKTGYEADEQAYFLADDAKVFIFNTKDCVPAEGGLTISNFEKVGDDFVYDTNAFVVFEDGKVALIVFDAAAEDITGKF